MCCHQIIADTDTDMILAYSYNYLDRWSPVNWIVIDAPRQIQTKFTHYVSWIMIIYNEDNLQDNTESPSWD